MALSDNLISYWPLDGNSTDVHGSNNGIDTAITYISGKIGQAADGNSSTSQINVGSANLNLSGDITISAWIKKSSNNYWFIVTRCNPAIGNYEFRTNPSGQIEFTCNGGGTNGGLLSNGTWHHVAGVRQGLVHKVYLNGAFLNSAAITAPSDLPSTDTIIGSRGDGFTHLGAHQVDEIGIWNRALSDSEIADLYNGGAGLSYSEINPAPPTVISIDPATGDSLGGTPVSITGTDFVDGAIIDIGGNPATSVVFINSTNLTATTPAGTGIVDVTVTNPDLQFDTLVGGFTYLSDSPVISGIYPIDARTIDVSFNKIVYTPDALTSTNYSITGSGGLTVFTVSKVSETTYRLITSKQTVGASYTITVSNVKDLNGNVI